MYMVELRGTRMGRRGGLMDERGWWNRWLGRAVAEEFPLGDLRGGG